MADGQNHAPCIDATREHASGHLIYLKAREPTTLAICVKRAEAGTHAYLANSTEIQNSTKTQFV